MHNYTRHVDRPGCNHALAQQRTNCTPQVSYGAPTKALMWEPERLAAQETHHIADHAAVHITADVKVALHRTAMGALEVMTASYPNRFRSYRLRSGTVVSRGK